MLWENDDDDAVKLVALYHAAWKDLEATVETDFMTNQVKLRVYGQVVQTAPIGDDMIAAIHYACAAWASQVCAACAPYPEA